jgi:hypothetical protein
LVGLGIRIKCEMFDNDAGMVDGMGKSGSLMFMSWTQVFSFLRLNFFS